MKKPTDRITKLQASHPWMSEDSACHLLVANYAVHTRTVPSSTPKTLQESMEQFTNKLCGLSEFEVKNILSRVQEVQS